MKSLQFRYMAIPGNLETSSCLVAVIYAKEDIWPKNIWPNS